MVVFSFALSLDMLGGIVLWANKFAVKGVIKFYCPAVD